MLLNTIFLHRLSNLVHEDRLLMRHRIRVYRGCPRLVVLLALCFSTGGSGIAQVENIQRKKPELPNFFIDALSFSSDTLGSRLDVYLHVPFEGLHFLKEGHYFKAKYEVNLGILSSTNTLLAERTWVENVKVATFEDTISPRLYSLVRRSFFLQPEVYKLRAEVRDDESMKTFRSEQILQVPDFTDRGLSLSDIMLVSMLTEEGGRKEIVPNIPANVGEQPEGFHLFFEVYNHSNLDTLELKYKIFSPKNKKVNLFANSSLQPISKGRTQIFLKVDSLRLPIGKYNLVVEARKPSTVGGKSDGEGELLAIGQKLLNAHWVGVPQSITDLDLAIDQMRYVAKESELQYVKEASTIDEKQQRFIDYWKKRDPTPGTTLNELMEEYFGRVEYANDHFAHHIEGWKTDMGMVYILFGSPNNVDRHPFEHNSKPYEVWYYYEQNRRFIFLDQSGFGDYRLITPFWEVWRHR